MNRQTPVAFNPGAAARGAAPTYAAPQSGRVPVEFIKAMKLIQGKPSEPSVRTFVMAAKTQLVQRRAAMPPVKKWKSSFKPVDGGDDSEEQDMGSSTGVELYDPYNPMLSDSELEVTDKSNLEQDNTLQHCLSQVCRKKSRWDCSDQDVQLLRSETRPCDNPGFSPGHRLPYNPDTEPLEPSRYDNIGRLVEHRVEHRVCSPDKTVHGASAQRFPTSYGGQRTNGEERMTEYRMEVSPSTPVLRLSPPRLPRDFHHRQGRVETGAMSTEMTRNCQKMILTDKSPITCDFCEVELANGQELEDHMDSKYHWDTLEHIQQQNGYDDLAIAFLQEVMLYKSRQYSRAIEDSALQALQENDHMTKVEMFHCAACDIFVSTSASSVQAHITSQCHLSNTKEFEAQQRRACLCKAETIIKELKPQFEHFMQGGTPFE